MPVAYYRLLPAAAASLSLLLAACTATRETQADANAAQLQPRQSQEASNPDGGMDTDDTIWTFLHIAKKSKAQEFGPLTGPNVSPELWQATLDTLSFAAMDSEDAQAGLAVTHWYGPKGKPDERLRITAFVKSRALRSDSLAVTIERQTRSASGQWQDGTVARNAVEDLENDILQRAREVHIARLRLDQ